MLSFLCYFLNTCTGNCWICCRCFRCVHTRLFLFLQKYLLLLVYLFSKELFSFHFFAPSKVLWADKPLLPLLHLPLLLLTQVSLLDPWLHLQQLSKPLRHVHEPRSIIHDLLSTSPWTTWSIWYSRRSSSCSAQRRGHRQPCHSCWCDHHSIIFCKIRNFSTKIPLSNKISRSIKRKPVSEHHSVPIVPLTTATAHPHGFSYGFAMFSQMITLLLLSFLCIFPSIWGLPTPFQMTMKMWPVRNLF